MRTAPLALCLLAGCAAPRSNPPPYREAGQLRSIDYVRAGWNQDEGSVVHTTVGDYSVYPPISGARGAHVWIDGHGRLHIQGTPNSVNAEGYVK